MPSLFGDCYTVYRTVRAKVLTGPAALTADQAKAYCGWEESKTSKDAPFQDANGKNIRLANAGCRAIDTTVARNIAQDVIQGRWRLSGQQIVLGRSGVILAGLELCVGLILASQQRDDVTLDVILITGVQEDDATYANLLPERPLTIADVVYRSHHFASLGVADRDRCARMVEGAIKFLWERCGPLGAERLTPGEAVGCLERHPRLIQAVWHIHEAFRPKKQERDDGPTRSVTPAGARYLPAGHAVGLLYLLGCSGTNGVKYREGKEELRWGSWDKAKSFWQLVAEGIPALNDVRRPAETGRGWGDYLFAEGEGSAEERTAAILCAWEAWREGRTPTVKDCTPEYRPDPDGGLLLVQPYIGGLDREQRVWEDGNEDTPELPAAQTVRQRQVAKLLENRAKRKASV